MSRVADLLHSGALRGAGLAVLIAASLFGMPMLSQAMAPASVSTPPHHALSKPSKQRVVSPYARAAAQREHAGQPSTGRGPTTVQAIGKAQAHKPHAAAPRK
jgi:hypothetical protein